ncbi:caspase family protein [Actinoplanes couchii]|uniref:Peptidase C14 caspase domain-containing protein n=1 Tax=Actinoplanes couchii TaxID=403638 RepID=A0ABQ3X810_9ACTN|nr:caspase family protein [Actinoplanes couchii]MDR6320335.1 hypothetical protein [Actinoplanes couchii]GID54651.1 hypothetical protein Aco03nite_030550 [Actinoplanes couchii]
MTTLYSDGGAGPRIHALVIGVGHYPHCVAYPPGTPESRLAADITPLTTAPSSALAVNRWLLDNLRDDPYVPLGSVETLISGPAPIVVPTPSGGTTVDPATFGNAREAVHRWRGRCDTDEDNVALFFFCGHGWERGDQTLLLEDLGRHPGDFFAGAVNFRRTYLGMRDCRARTQLYFIDACRELPLELLEIAADESRPLLTVRNPLEPPGRPLDAPVFHATTPGLRAYGPPGEPTPFTEAVLDVLGGRGAHQPRWGSWEIHTDRIAPSVRRMMQWNGVADQRPTAEGVTISSRFRTLPGPPAVPFRLSCAPAEALYSARLSLTALDDPANGRVREPRGEPWQNEVPAGNYQVRAEFPPAAYQDVCLYPAFLPPVVDEVIPVEPA